MFIRIILSIFAFVLFTSATRIQSVIPQLEEVIQQGMEESHIPGAAVAIVQGDKVVYSKGFGYRNLAKKQKVTPDTVFQLASVSKPITSTILAKLVADGKIQWDSKITNLNPSFQLSDPWVTANVTIKDFLSHRSGLPDHAGDLLEDLGYSREQIAHQLRYIAPLAPFRESYAYTNFGFSEAAYATSHFLKKSWDDLVRETLYRPLGMKSTSSSFKDFIDNPQRAVTYMVKDGEPVALDPPRQPDAQTPAGGVSSSLKDMAKWLIYQLKPNETLEQTHAPVMLTSKSGPPSFYGMGWGVTYDGGHTFLKHSGGFNLGIRSQVALLPDEKIGIVVLTNASPSGFPEAITQTFFDLYLGKDLERGLVEKFNQKWLDHMVEPEKSYVATQEFSSLPLRDYVGRYQNDYFGEVEIKKKGKKLVLMIGPEKRMFPLRHLNRDVFTFVTEGENAEGETQVIFLVDESDKVRQLTVDYLNKFGAGVFKSEKNK